MKSVLLPLLALLAGCLTVIAAAKGYLAYFLNLEGLLIVIGGSVANAFLSFHREDVWKAVDTIRDMLKNVPSGREKLHRDIMQLMSWAYVVQTRDFIGLEKDHARRVRDPIMRYGMNLVVTDYYGADKIREMISTVADAEFERRCAPVTVLRNMAATAPAFGMVGTLIGMIVLLKDVGTDITAIGGGLAIAMLSTLYGILIARLVCLPAADKLLQREETAHFHNHMLAEGFALLAEKRSPFYMQDKLNSFLEPSKHFDLDSYQELVHDRQPVLAA